MTGKYDIEIYNKRVHYHLTVKRNITVIICDETGGFFYGNQARKNKPIHFQVGQ